MENTGVDVKELQKKKKLLLELFADSLYVPMKIKELAIFLNVEKERRTELEAVLEALVNEGKVELSKRGKYTLAKEKSYVGIYTANPRGFGFVAVEDMEEDFFVPEGMEESALHGDEVRIQLLTKSSGKRKEVRVVEVLKRANQQIVGLYKKNKSFGFILPDNQKILKDIYIPLHLSMDAKSGQKVVAEIHDFGNVRKKPEGRIIEILGDAKDVGVDIDSMIRVYGIEEEFPPEVLKEAEKIPDTVSKEEIDGRLDLREVLTITIDGEDAKDLDDAISLSMEGEYYRLGVHIADVSHYVGEGSALDIEALKRSTSIYLVDRVIPMLPKNLSNGICSLNEQVDRLSLSCIMDIDKSGKVVSHQIIETVIRVNHRMTYTDVHAILSGDALLREKYSDITDLLQNMSILSKLLRDRRYERGAIDFDIPETKVILDEKGRPVEIKPYERNQAHKIIEDFMLIANETVAEEYFWLELPFLYRTHENPDPEKMQSLSTFIHNFGFHIRLKKGDIHAKELQRLLLDIEGSPAELMISRITLRSMKKARYQSECIGHFGLSAKYYTHFTSPIRRYPDLQIHRIIKENIKGMTENRISHYDTILGDVALQTSNMEKRAEEIERESIKYKKCEYMQKFLMEEFDGVISGVNQYGLYVELENTVEGFIRISDLDDDYYIYHEQAYEVEGEKTRKKYRLGDKIRVRVIAVDKMTKTIDFYPVRQEVVWEQK